MADLAMEILNDKVRFLQKPMDGRITRKRLYPTYQPWIDFMENVKRLKLTMNPQEKTLEKIWNWLNVYVSPSLKLFSELGKAEEKDYLGILVDRAEMNMTQRRLFEDYMKSLGLQTEQAENT